MDFVCVKMIYNTVFVKCVYYFTLQICVFVTCSTSCYVYDTLMDPWNVCMCVCMCVYVCMYVCMCVFVCVCMHVCVCMYACMHACMCVCVCMCMYACMHVCMCVYVCMCLCVYMYEACSKRDRTFQIARQYSIESALRLQIAPSVRF